EGAVFTEGDASRAWAWAEPFSSKVVKPTDGNQGKGVHADIRTWDEFSVAFEEIFQNGYKKVLVEEFCSGTEHRCLLVKNKLVAATRRRPASVLGNGIDSIKTLVSAKNADRGLIHKKITLGAIETRELLRQ